VRFACLSDGLPMTAARLRAPGCRICGRASDCSDWPQPGWRPIVSEPAMRVDREDSFVMERRGEIQHALNNAVGRSYITGWFADPARASAQREASDTFASTPRGELSP